MITNVSMNSFRPAFGLAKLSEEGKAAANDFGYQQNEFLNPSLFTRVKGRASKSPLAGELAQRSFSEIATDYGSADNSVANAQFIKTQVLSKKGSKVLRKTPNQDQVTEGLKILWDANFDNPSLNAKDTKKLLERIKTTMAPADYIRCMGILNDAE